LTNRVVDLIAESQRFEGGLIRLSEHSTSRPLTDYQRRVLISQGNLLDFLALQLLPQLDGSLYLRASKIVGATRFVHEKEAVVVQVEPKIEGLDFLRMLDYALGSQNVDQHRTMLSTSKAPTVSLFLQFFTEEVLAFLQGQNFRGYSFRNSSLPGRVKGRPLVSQYFTHSLPQANPQILPHRFLDFSTDVIENQVIAYAVHAAIQLASLLPPSTSMRLGEMLRKCKKLLQGVTVRRITTKEIDQIRYDRINQPFKSIHQLCRAILVNQSITLQAGSKIPFLSFAVDMANLFELYVKAVFTAAFGKEFCGDKRRLTYSLDAHGKHVKLDGLLTHKDRKLIVECKYKDVGAHDNDDWYLVGGKIRGTDVYQAIAYASHRNIRANASLLVFPSQASQIPSSLAKPISSLGWYPEALTGTTVHLLGLNLSADFSDLVEAVRFEVDRITRNLPEGPPQSELHP